jgi:hypothetical protein
VGLTHNGNAETGEPCRGLAAARSTAPFTDEAEVLEGRDAVSSALVADAAGLHAAERRVGKRRGHLVDPDVGGVSMKSRAFM